MLVYLWFPESLKVEWGGGAFTSQAPCCGTSFLLYKDKDTFPSLQVSHVMLPTYEHLVLNSI